MSGLQFEMNINAPVSHVYSKMFEKETYQKWCAAFNPTSSFEGSWEPGSEILFLGTDENGEQGGMIGNIQENIPNKSLVISYSGMIIKGKRVTEGPEVDAFVGKTERYYFEEIAENKCLLRVQMDSFPEFEEYFSETWPKALAILKGICEAGIAAQ